MSNCRDSWPEEKFQEWLFAGMEVKSVVGEIARSFLEGEDDFFRSFVSSLLLSPSYSSIYNCARCFSARRRELFFSSFFLSGRCNNSAS